MTVSAYWYGKGFLSVWNKEIDWAADAIYVALCTSTYTPDQDTHDYYNDLTNEVANGNGYATGGMLLPTPTIGYTAGTNVIKLDGGDCAWTASTITARYAVIYDSTPGSAATNPLIAYIDFGADVSSVSGTFTITWHTDGILTITPTAPA
jgi:hypothetical protein